MPIAWMRRVNTRPKARSLSRTIYVGARSQGNASVIWRANHSAVGQRDRNKALFLFDQDSFLLRALGATEYALLVTGRVGRLNAIKPHTPAAVRTQRLSSENCQVACRDHFLSRHLRSPILRWSFYWVRVGACGNSKGAVPFTDWLILARQVSRVEKGPSKRWPCSFVAYQPSLTARKSD